MVRSALSFRSCLLFMSRITTTIMVIKAMTLTMTAGKIVSLVCDMDAPPSDSLEKKS